MVAINRAALAENLWPGILSWFGAAYTDFPTQYTELFDARTSSKAYEELQAEYGFGLAPVKPEGRAIQFDEAGNSWTARLEHKAYALGFVVTREAVDDNLYGDLVPKYTRSLKRSMMMTKEVRGAAIYDRAFNPLYKGGDGEPLCSADHPLHNGKTWSNTGTPADLNETSLEAAIISIADWTDERGLRVSIKGRKLIVGNGLQFTAERLLRTQNRVGTADNDINALRSMGMIPDGYAVNNYLINRAQWFIRTDVTDGMLWFNRVPLDVDQGDGLDNQVMKVVAYERYSAGWADPRGLYGQPG